MSGDPAAPTAGRAWLEGRVVAGKERVRSGPALGASARACLLQGLLLVLRRSALGQQPRDPPSAGFPCRHIVALSRLGTPARTAAPCLGVL